MCANSRWSAGFSAPANRGVTVPSASKRNRIKSPSPSVNDFVDGADPQFRDVNHDSELVKSFRHGRHDVALSVKRQVQNVAERVEGRPANEAMV